MCRSHSGLFQYVERAIWSQLACPCREGLESLTEWAGYNVRARGDREVEKFTIMRNVVSEVLTLHLLCLDW